MPSGGREGDEFRIGHVFSQTFSVLTQNFLKLCLVAGAAFLPLLAMPKILPAELMRATSLGPAALNLSAINPYTLFGPLAVAFVVMMVVLNVGQAIVFYVAVEYIRRGSVNLAEGLRVAVGRFFPLIGIGFLVFLASIGVGVLSVIVAAAFAAIPGLPGFVKVLVSIALIALYAMLMLMWIVATPACVVERLGPLRSLGRSRELTKGHRWKILGLLLLTLISFMLVGALVGVILFAGIGLGAAFILGPALGQALGQAVGLVWDGIFFSFFWVLIAVVYRDLRVAKEGIDTDQISTVFE
jgi:hypothetical protein